MTFTLLPGRYATEAEAALGVARCGAHGGPLNACYEEGQAAKAAGQPRQAPTDYDRAQRVAWLGGYDAE